MRVPFFFAVALPLAAALAAGTSARAQSDAGTDVDGGPADGGVAACDPSCTTVDGGPAVTFCDPTAPDAGSTTIACSNAGGVEGAVGCGDIPGWGPDCVLGNGAACDPGYAFGASRCDPGTVVDGQHLFCVGGKCAPAASKPLAPPAPVPTAGTHTEPTATSALNNPLSCLGCQNTGTTTPYALLFGALLSLRALPRAVRRLSARR